MTDAATSNLTDRELQEIKRANDSGLTPIAFVHGLWLLSSSWQNWRDFFEEHGYATIAPGWPDDPATLGDAYKNPDVFAHKMVQGVTDHYLDAISRLEKKPAVIGHSFGGLISLKIAGEGASFANRLHRQRALQRRAAAPAERAEVGSAGARKPRQSRQGHRIDVRAVQVRLDQ
jgi:non-heme chloroperoxidase